MMRRPKRIGVLVLAWFVVATLVSGAVALARGTQPQASSLVNAITLVVLLPVWFWAFRKDQETKGR